MIWRLLLLQPLLEWWSAFRRRTRVNRTILAIILLLSTVATACGQDVRIKCPHAMELLMELRNIRGGVR